MPAWRRLSAAAGLAAGAVAAGAGVAVAARRLAVGRIRLRPDPEAGEPFGQLGGRPLAVRTGDGLPLHVAVSGPDDASVTVVFCHGYALNADVWHYQRTALEGTARLVWWDHRSHGRSGRSDAGAVTIRQLAEDLRAVLTAAAPGRTGIVLVGHSMGAMTIMALADAYPELFGTTVGGAVLISAPAAPADLVRWLPAPLRPAARRGVPALLTRAANGALAATIERGRRSAGDLAFLATRYLAFGGTRVSPALVDFLERMIRETPVNVVAEFYLALGGYGSPTPAALSRVPVLVLTGDRDRIVDPRCSEEVAAAIPGAELVVIRGAGHVPLLEAPDTVNEAIKRVIELRLPQPDAGVPAAAQAWLSDPGRMREFGRQLAPLLRRGDLVLVSGPLGAGKTTLVQGIGAGLGVTGPVTSPTFVIARVHRPAAGGPALVHADGYRIGSPAELDDLDLDAGLEDSVTVIEWGEDLAEMLSPDYLRITITRPAAGSRAGMRPDERRRADSGDEAGPRLVAVQPHGDRWATEAPALRQALAAAAGGHSSVLSGHASPGNTTLR